MPTVKEIFATMEYGPAPESPDFVNAWLEKHGRRFGHFINGRFVEGSNSFEVINPANKAVIATVSQGSNAEIDQAVQAAGAAFEYWRSSFRSSMTVIGVSERRPRTIHSHGA